MESQTAKFLEFDVAEESSCSQTIEDDSTMCKVGLHMSNSYWLRGLHLILLSNHLRFPSNGKMPCVTCEPHLS